MVSAAAGVKTRSLHPRESLPPKRLSILGATGSIGRSCAQVIANAPGKFSVVSLAGGRDGAALAKSAIELGAEFAALADPAGYADLKAGVAGFEIEIAAGPEAVEEAALRDADLVVSAIVGAAGLRPTFAAIAAGRTVALANKETLVCAGDVVMERARRTGSMILPMDSEHNALFQAIGARDPATIEMMTITASGGPFREWSAERIFAATREEALAHPNWVMGPKVTIDSAGLMNKGLELIEAHYLFGLPADRLDVVVHPQSIVHGLIAFADGSLIAGMASPDMRTPIAHCLAYPDRIASGVRAPDLAALGRLTFERADFESQGKTVKKVAIMVVNTELGKSWADNFAKYWGKLPGASVVGKASYDANDTDFYPQLSTLLPNEPDALILTTVCQPSAIVIKQARELGFKGPIINSAACSGEELTKLLPTEQTNGTILELSGWGASDPSIDAFKKAYQDTFKLNPQQISGLGYDGLRWLVKAVSDAGTVDDATKIRAAMPAALTATKTMFSMSNLDEAGDIDMPVLVGVMADGKLSAFSGAK